MEVFGHQEGESGPICPKNLIRLRILLFGPWKGVLLGGGHHRIRSIQNAQQVIRHSSVIFVAPYWNYRISCLKVQLAPLAQDSEKWNISLDYVKKGLSPDLEYFRLPTSKRSRLIIIMPSHCYWS